MKKNILFVLFSLLGTICFAGCDKKAEIAVYSQNDNGSVYGGGKFAVGDTAVIYAEPKEGYEFERWDDGNTEQVRTINVEENKEYRAIFVEKKHTYALGDVEIYVAKKSDEMLVKNAYLLGLDIKANNEYVLDFDAVGVANYLHNGISLIFSTPFNTDIQYTQSGSHKLRFNALMNEKNSFLKGSSVGMKFNLWVSCTDSHYSNDGGIEYPNQYVSHALYEVSDHTISIDGESKTILIHDDDHGFKVFAKLNFVKI